MNCSVRNDRNPSKAQADSPATGHDLSRLGVARNHSTFIALPCAVYGRINILRAGVLILLAVASIGGACAIGVYGARELPWLLVFIVTGVVIVVGYTVFGQLPDYPEGHSRFFLQKRL